MSPSGRNPCGGKNTFYDTLLVASMTQPYFSLKLLSEDMSQDQALLLAYQLLKLFFFRSARPFEWLLPLEQVFIMNLD